MTYLSMLDDSQSEQLGGGFAAGDTTFILGFSLTSLKQTYDITQSNKAINNVQTPALGSGNGLSRWGGGGSPFYAASVSNYLQNIAVVG